MGAMENEAVNSCPATLSPHPLLSPKEVSTGLSLPRCSLSFPYHHPVRAATGGKNNLINSKGEANERESVVISESTTFRNLKHDYFPTESS